MLDPAVMFSVSFPSELFVHLLSTFISSQETRASVLYDQPTLVRIELCRREAVDTIDQDAL